MYNIRPINVRIERLRETIGNLDGPLQERHRPGRCKYDPDCRAVPPSTSGVVCPAVEFRQCHGYAAMDLGEAASGLGEEQFFVNFDGPGAHHLVAELGGDMRRRTPGE